MALYGTIPNEGKQDLLSYQIRQWGTEPNPWSLRLFKNDFEPREDMVLADLVECDFTTYVPWTLYRSAWQPPIFDGDTVKSIWGPTVPFWNAPSTPQFVWGVYYTDDDLNVIRFCYKWADAFEIKTGQPLSVIPMFTYGTRHCE